MALIDKITSGRELLELPVPEWEETIFYYPYTLADNDYSTKMAKGSDAAFIAYTIIRKVLDSEAKPHFTVADKLKLMRETDPDVLTRIVIDMKGDVDAGKD